VAPVELLEVEDEEDDEELPPPVELEEELEEELLVLPVLPVELDEEELLLELDEEELLLELLEELLEVVPPHAASASANTQEPDSLNKFN
jgi:hypothetical protein